MKVYQKISGRPLNTPALRPDRAGSGVNIPAGTTIYRWDTITKLQIVFGFLRNDLDENRQYIDSFEVVNPKDVTWFYIEEKKPRFADEWLLIDEYEDPIAGGAGSQGPQGTVGTNGLQGNQGSVGTGIRGPQGTAGTNGLQGSQGDVGLTGSGTQGPQGSGGVGPQGDVGFQGVVGSGLQGSAGSAGLQGFQGEGVQGVQGSAGLQGFQGEGVQGSAGTNGLQGPVGVQGVAGVCSKFVANIGDGGATGITVTHNLNTKDIVWSARDNSTDEFVLLDVKVPTVDTALFTFDTAPTSNQYRVVIIG
jgi:hypothetical protein